ncbi:MAG: hypothetical protein AB7G37_00190 [Solirubrobacteraceae bacterium]
MHLEMQGLGYFHPEWAHGTPHGELRVGREDLVLADARPDEPQRLHRQLLCRVTARHEDGARRPGSGSWSTSSTGRTPR